MIKHLYPLISRFGTPCSIISDNGPAFISSVLKELCKQLGIKKLFTSPYYPQADGIAESFMKVLGHQLAKLVNDKHSNWSVFLPQILFAYRSTPHPATGESPFYLMHGFDPAWPTDVALQQWSQPEALTVADGVTLAEHTRGLQQARLDAWRTLLEIYSKSAVKHNIANPNHTMYETGDLILVRITPNDQKHLPSKKLATRWVGPYRVLKRFSNDLTYEVKELISGRLRKVHVSHTRPFLALTETQLETAESLHSLPKVKVTVGQ